MCLVLAFTNTKKLNLSQCLNDIGNTLLKEEEDGFGYAIKGKFGVFGEKTISKRFRTRLTRINEVKLPIVNVKYMRFGTPGALDGPGLFHGRTSTNVIDLNNTHPMQIDGWNLIHNGVVTDLGPAYAKNTDNDSEDVLKRLIDSVGQTNPMESIEKNLEGYYAFGAIDPMGRLHIGRDDYAPLHIAYSSKYETFIIGTTESLILKVSKILDAKIGPIDEIQGETYCIFNGNDLIHCQEFKSRGFTPRQSVYAAQSLGHALPTGEVTVGLGMQPPETRNIRDVSGHNYSGVSEADWQDSIVDYLEKERQTVNEDMVSGIQSEIHEDRFNSISEDTYYKYRREIDNMDASYQVFSPEDRPITMADFKKLDHVSQEMCTVVRSDGTVVDPEDYETRRFRGSRE